ncbi:MAG TPA: response regulator [Candidatus Acidoferrum sp.]|jgi:CheY-like chemotaxis protein
MALPDSPKKQRIIIVEDNALVAKFFSMALERGGGYSCLITEDVPAILEEVQAGLVDLVLLDISLTSAEWEGRSVDGIELCRILKLRSPRRLPVLLATAHAMSGDRERFLESSGADGYLEKPVFDSAVLIQRVRDLIDGTRK